VRLVTVVADADEADELFEFIHGRARIGRPGGGTIFMTPLIMATWMGFPPGVPTEPDS
jgi:nitrogen regulatory protein PII